MLTFHSFLQGICQFVKTCMVNVTKRMHRSAAVFMAGSFVVAVVAFTSSGFGGGGKNALAAFSEAPAEEESQEEKPEEDELITEAKVQVELTDSRRQGQLLVGDLLEKDVQKQQENEQAAKAEIIKIKTEILMEAQAEAIAQAEEAARQAEEEAKRRAQEAAKASAVGYSDGDYQVLLRIVQAEAGICDEKGKILVANVILNRVRSNEFPGTITDVVYEHSQFSPVSDGSINRVKVTSQTIDCVNRALGGEDYSQGALYFMNRRGSRSRAVSWFDSHLTFLFRHENHEFFK